MAHKNDDTQVCVVIFILIGLRLSFQLFSIIVTNVTNDKYILHWKTLSITVSALRIKLNRFAYNL